MDAFNHPDSFQESARSFHFFDPFTISPDHSNHSQHTNIIRLEESGKVFCPLCLEKVSFTGIKDIDDDLFDQYVKNFFETLDQQSHNDQIRRIIITILQSILKERPIIIKRDHDFHNLIRIIHKVTNNQHFCHYEFSSVANILSRIMEKFVQLNAVPLLSIWKATNHLLSYAKKQLYQLSLESSNKYTPESIDFIGSIAILIKTYLQILRRFSISQVSDLIFPLHENDTPMTHNRKYFIETQECCLLFACDLVPIYWPLIKSEKLLGQQERAFIADFFESLSECLIASMRLDERKFVDLLAEKDCILMSHNLIYRNPERDFREKIRLFLKNYAMVTIYCEFGQDDLFNIFINSGDIVETNHKNAIAFCNSLDRNKRSLFYLVINYIAFKQQSKYLNTSRLKRVLKSVDPNSINVCLCRATMKIYLSLVSSFISRVGQLDNIETFILKQWNEMNGDGCFLDFNDLFCVDEKVFFWAHMHPDFVDLISSESISQVVKSSINKGTLSHTMKKLLHNKRYRVHTGTYLKENDHAIEMTEKICEFDSDIHPKLDRDAQHHRELVLALSATLPAILHEEILDLSSEVSNDITKVERIVKMILMLLKECKHFNMTLDDRYIMDLFIFMEVLYMKESYDPLLSTLNEIVTVLIKNTDPWLMSILKHMNYTVLGYMYHRLADYSNDDVLVDSIAQLLIAYEEIDYPLQHNIGSSLSQMSLSILNWMLSKNHHLHILSIKLTERVFRTETVGPTRACAASGFIHMLLSHQHLIQNKSILNTLYFISSADEIIYNPLIDRLFVILPDSLKEFILINRDQQENRPVSPALSFSSVESDSYDEDRAHISTIVNQLSDNVDGRRKIPKNLYVAKFLRDTHIANIRSDVWEELASQAMERFTNMATQQPDN